MQIERYQIRMPNGDIMDMYRTDDGQIACPICGTFGWDVPWTDEDDPKGASASFNLCHICHVTYGYEDSVPDSFPLGSTHRIWMDYRIEWLNKSGWKAEDLDRLERVLGITRSELEKAKQEIASRPHTPPPRR